MAKPSPEETPPLSEVKMTTVLSRMPAASMASTTRPTASSSAAIMAGVHGMVLNLADLLGAVDEKTGAQLRSVSPIDSALA